MQCHVLQCLDCRLTFGGILDVFRHRNNGIDGHHLTRVGTPGDLRRNIGTVQLDNGVKLGIVIGLQSLPVGHSLFPLLAFGRERLALEVVEGGLIGGDQAGLGAQLDGHVTDGHAGFHRQRRDGAATEFHHITGTAGVADLADNGQHHVFGADTRLELTVDLNLHGSGPALLQGLGGHDVFHFGGADTKGQGTKGTVGSGVGVAADDGGAGQGQAQLGTDHVHYALVLVVQIIERHAELFTVAGQRFHLDAGHFTGGGDVVGLGGHVVVHGRPGAIRAAQLAAFFAQAVKGLGRGHFMYQMTVDIQQRRFAGLIAHQVGIEYFLIEGGSH